MKRVLTATVLILLVFALIFFGQLWMITLFVLHSRGEIDRRSVLWNAATHGLLGVLFLVAFVITPKVEPPQ